MKGVIVGFGNVAEQSHLPAWRKLGIEMSVFDISYARSQVAQRVHNLDIIERESYITVYDHDFIDICTPTSEHLEYIKMAGEFGIPVICEKPLCTPSQLEKLKQIVEDHKIKLYPVNNWRYAPQYIAVKKDLKRIGKLQSLSFSTQRRAPDQGVSEWIPNWRVKKEISGGGILLDHGYHYLYLIQYFLPNFNNNFDIMSIKLDKNGVEFGIFLYSKGKPNVSISLDWDAPWDEVVNYFYSDRGTFLLDDNSIVLSGRVVYSSEKMFSKDKRVDWYVDLFKDFINGKSHYEEALWVMEKICNIYEKLKRGKGE